jgi:hypothetical protein
MDQKSVQVFTGISPNILRACSENHCIRVIKTKITRDFWSGSSKTIPFPHIIKNLLHQNIFRSATPESLSTRQAVLWQQNQIRVSWLRGEKKRRWACCTWARNSARKRWAPTAKLTGGENRCRKISSGHRSQSPSRRTNRGESASTVESSLGRDNHGKRSRASPGIETRATETAGKNPKRSRPKRV